LIGVFWLCFRFVGDDLQERLLRSAFLIVLIVDRELRKDAKSSNLVWYHKEAPKLSFFVTKIKSREGLMLSEESSEEENVK